MIITDFQDMPIKEAYEKNPKISYPMITVLELDNSEDTRYSTSMGEEFSRMSYQIDIYTRDIPTMQANKIIRILGNKVNEVLGENMKMVREGNPSIVPLPTDKTVMRYTIRYSCVFDIIRNIIYKD